MNKKIFYFLLIPFIGVSQIQIGEDIDGKLTIGSDVSGDSVSLSSDGSIVAIGAVGNDGNGSSSGHVRIYKNISSVWTQVGMDIDGEASSDFSGESISLSSDGSIVAIGASNNDGNGTSSGHVRIYKNISNVWTQIGLDIDGEVEGDLSGSSVSLSSDGNVVAIGSMANDGNGEDSGHVRIYKNISDVWTQIGLGIDGEAAGDLSGESVSLSNDGNVVAIGARNNDGNGSSSGHVRIYKNISNVWTQIGLDIDGESVGNLSGRSISLSSDGSVVAIGAGNNSGNGSSSGHVRIYKNISNVWTQVGFDIDGEAEGDASGNSISLSSDGSVVAIGAINNDDNGGSSGHVRIYINESDVWTQVGLDIDGEEQGDTSGSSVSLSNDGNVVAIGARNNDGNGILSGHVRIYKNESGVWTQVNDDIDGGEPTGGLSGDSVSLSSDGSIIAVGTTRSNTDEIFSGHVSIYKNISNVWSQVGMDIYGEGRFDRFGSSVSLSSDGSVVAAASTKDSGRVEIYKNESDVWTQVGLDIYGESKGGFLIASISLSSNGSIIAIGGRGNDENGVDSGNVRIYKNESDTWVQIGQDIYGEAEYDNSGYSVSLSSDGNLVAIGAPGNDENGSASGHVRVYKNELDVWTQVGMDINGKAENDRSGENISLSNDGNVVAIGARGNDSNGEDSGHVRIYKNISSAWTQVGMDIDGEAQGDSSGNSISLSSDGGVVAIGTTNNDGNGVSSGHVRIYKNVSNVWTQVGLDIDGEAEGDSSGGSVSLSSDGSVVAIGATGNDGNAFGSGHVRIYDLSAVLSVESFKVDYFSIYPNPTKNKLEITLNSSIEFKQLNIYTALGRYLYSEKSLAIDISNLSSGMYILEVETNKGMSSRKMIKE